MKKIIFNLCRFLGAVIMLQTLYFKFTAHPDSVHIFSLIGIEPWGRIGVGIMELIASVLLFIPTTIWLGGLMSVGLMMGAVFFHILFLGIEVNNDGGKLFWLAIVVVICGLVIVWNEKEKLLKVLPFKILF
ncbi:MAG: DoxX family protein [Flammeovirgaceae bacterium]